MKSIAVYVAATAMCIALLFGVFYAMRTLNMATAPVEVQEVEPGVKCAKMVTSDGAAISCWQERG